MITAGVSFDNACIDREALALDEPRVHARTHHRFEQLGPNPASRAAKKVAGSWPPGEMQPVPTRP